MVATLPIIWILVAAAITFLAGLLAGLALRRPDVRAARRWGALDERLARIDAAQTRIETLSGDVLGLQDILSNKQARGAFGEIQLREIVTRALPPDAVSWQPTLSTGRRPDCLIHLPDAPLVIDAKFPLESYEALVADPSPATRTAFRAAIRAHLRAIAERYLIAGETADGALMFLPSEAIFAELHAHHGALVREGFAAGVYTVSPTTCMATLNTMRAILKDHRLRECAAELRGQLGLLHADVDLVARRAAALTRHLDLSRRDLDGLATATTRLTRRSDRIDALDFAAASPPAEPRARIIHRA